VPAIVERVVTRVVYKRVRSYRGAAGPSVPSKSNPANNIAGARSDATAKTAISLIGFKPTDQVNLTIIKGSNPK
jgi:hypothetical protein